MDKIPETLKKIVNDRSLFFLLICISLFTLISFISFILSIVSIVSTKPFNNDDTILESKTYQWKFVESISGGLCFYAINKKSGKSTNKSCIDTVIIKDKETLFLNNLKS